MANIAQGSLFSWEIVEKSSEIFRLQRVLEILPDSDVIDALQKERKGRRDDYPVIAIWNSIIAGIVFGHESIASLRRELLRNGELRQVCGFDPLLCEAAVPGDWVYSRFLAKLIDKSELVEAMFKTLVDRVGALLGDFGQSLAIDGKALPTHGPNDPDADTGVKKYRGTKKDGALYEKFKNWFGYNLHLIVDSKYELPVAFELTKASESETDKLLPMIEGIEKEHPEIYERIEEVSADRGYDSAANKAGLYDDHDIMPVIDTRDMHTNKPQGAMRPLDPQRHDTIYIGPTGEVCCKVDPFTTDADKMFANMSYMGFEKDRGTLKFRCPAAACGVECKNREACKGSYTAKNSEYGRVVRVPIDTDRRRFMPIHLHSRTFKIAYRKRSAVERVNSRIDNVYGFERHFIRGIKKMKLRVSLALIVMLATAAAWIEMGQADNMRSLVKAA